MGNEALSSFFSQQSEEDMKARQQSVDNASAVGGDVVYLEDTGRFLMEVATFAYKDKNTKEMKTSPELYISERTNSLILKINLRVADGVGRVPAGASLFTNIVISPAQGASAETIRNTARMMKPRIAALTGEEKISVDPAWLEEWLVPTYDEKDGQYVLVKDHKMKQKVMVLVEEDEYNNRIQYSVAAISKAKEGDKSILDETPSEETPQQKIAQPSSSDIDSMSASDAIETDDSQPAQGDVPETPTVTDDF